MRLRSARGLVPLAVFALVFGAEPARAESQLPDNSPLSGAPPPRAPTFQFSPTPLPSGALKVSAGVLVDVLPARVVEGELRQIPALQLKARLGVVGGLDCGLRLRGNVVGNELALEVGYAVELGPVAVRASDAQGIAFGYFGVEDAFAAFAWSLTNTPAISVGIPWKNHRFSIVGEAYLSLAQHTTLGDATKTSRGGAVLSGVGATLVVETAFARGNAIYYGAGLMHTTPDYQAWVAFSDERQRLYYPRIVGGYEF